MLFIVELNGLSNSTPRSHAPDAPCNHAGVLGWHDSCHKIYLQTLQDFLPTPQRTGEQFTELNNSCSEYNFNHAFV